MRFRRAGSLVAVVLGVTAFAALTVHCNVWTSLSNCDIDADCTSSFRCDLSVNRCVPRATPTDAAAPDVATDAPSSDAADSGPACDTLPWGKPKLVRGLETTQIVGGRLSPDELSMVLTLSDAIGTNSTLSTASRSSLTDPFHVDGPIPVVNAKGTSAFWPTMSADGLLLFFESNRSKDLNDAGGHDTGGIRIWTASRVSKLGDFSEPRLQSLFDVAVSDTVSETAPYVHPSGRSLYFASSGRDTHGLLDLYVASIGSLGTVTSISNIEGVNTTTAENAPVVTMDERSLYFGRYQGEVTRVKIFVSHRASTSNAFGAGTRVDALNSGDDADDYPSWVSPDHCRIYIASTRLDEGVTPDSGAPHLFRVWVAERERP
ncbi:MAG: hypothetical protein U0174_18625 [Polyangiaceae bacterium]